MAGAGGECGGENEGAGDGLAAGHWQAKLRRRAGMQAEVGLAEMVEA